ncbi:hypothetical protein ACFX1Q_020909 [Malus domestica]
MSRFARVVQDNLTRLVKVAIGVNLARVRRMAAYFSNISRQADYAADPRAASALHDCFARMSNVQMWMSTALTNEETWTDGFDVVERMR